MSYPYPYPYPWSRTRTRTHTRGLEPVRTHTHGLVPIPVPVPMICTHTTSLEHKQIVFPPQIAETAKRSDITIYSERTRPEIIIELTVPMQEKLSSAYTRKKCKYLEDLVAECENRGGVSTTFLSK